MTENIEDMQLSYKNMLNDIGANRVLNNFLQHGRKQNFQRSRVVSFGDYMMSPLFRSPGIVMV